MRTQTDPSAAPALDAAPYDTDSVVAISTVRGHHEAAGARPEREPVARPEREPFARLRRLRGDADAQSNGATDEDETALKLQVMLLSEENARLKAARHRPSDVGTLIDQMRLLGAREGEGEVLDETWTMLSECVVIREGLDQACIEIQSAIGDVRDRLAALTIRLDDGTPVNVQADPGLVLPRSMAS